MTNETNTPEDENTVPQGAEVIDDTAEVVEVIETAETSLEDRIEELEAANAKLADQFVRAKAETDNTRRISTQEVAKARKFALEGFAKELLSVKDSLDHAAVVDLSAHEADPLVVQMQEGLALTIKQMDSVFERFNVEAIVPERGDELDPELHQAMTMQPSTEVSANHVLQTIQKGYTLNERLIRAAMVIVSKGA